MKKHVFLLVIFLSSFQIYSQKEYKSSEYYEMIEKHPFGSISDKYTLIISGFFDDYGEFGGHEETIELIRIEKKLSAIVTIYDMCTQETNYAKPKVIKTETYLIDENKVLNFQVFMNELLKKSLEFSAPFHAGKVYSATLGYKNEDGNDKVTSQRIKISYHDSWSTWTEFQKLKNIVEN